MHQINTRGTFLVSKMCIPHLKLAANPHILNLAPPLDMDAKWFRNHTAYTMAKFGMSMCTLGMSAEFAKAGIAVNSLWPLTAIDTAAVRNLLGGQALAAMSRLPDIMADAAHSIVTRPARETTGNFFIDELVLREEGVTDFSAYAPDAKGPLAADFFVPEWVFEKTDTKLVRALG
jgi:citronellol/citronellal dehydrogenase